jgi:hypothetical protein
MRTKVLLLVLGLVILVVLWFACPWTDQAPGGKLVIQDVHLAAWMTTNNTFNANAKAYWEGVLIQVGHYLDDKGCPTTLFKNLTIKNADNTVNETLASGDFEWIDIVAVDASRPDPPMEETHVELLYPASNKPSNCQDCDKNCGTKAACPGMAGNLEFEPCLRLRSLHGFFMPFALITYWQGPGGYDVGVRNGPLARPGESEYTFTFKDPVHVRVYGNQDKDLGVGKFTISLNVEGVGNHGGKHDPGWR